MKTLALNEAIEKAGGQTKLARRLGKYPQLIQSWEKHGLPAKWAIPVEEATGVPRHKLRPDIYPAPQASP
jgi:DNA-binding transcriptional regulator YdaS (Cro superfamily)